MAENSKRVIANMEQRTVYRATGELAKAGVHIIIEAPDPGRYAVVNSIYLRSVQTVTDRPTRDTVAVALKAGPDGSAFLTMDANTRNQALTLDLQRNGWTLPAERPLVIAVSHDHAIEYRIDYVVLKV